MQTKSVQFDLALHRRRTCRCLALSRDWDATRQGSLSSTRSCFPCLARRRVGSTRMLRTCLFPEAEGYAHRSQACSYRFGKVPRTTTQLLHRASSSHSSRALCRRSRPDNHCQPQGLLHSRRQAREPIRAESTDPMNHLGQALAHCRKQRCCKQNPHRRASTSRVHCPRRRN